jgi:hypothetical protein
MAGGGQPLGDDVRELVGRDSGVVAAMIWIKPFSPSAARVLRSSSSIASSGSVCRHSGCCAASAFTRSIANTIWK